ncbi:hypothetical protein POWCR01_080034300 [Plasmodium ovale]|uniref:Uncharacterized protein n=1 Tax=Plasmodium ovale TaxID=36330 RepID=A0A1C3KRS8_PLAOA|nr:hypothetical protein POWCR01_080034300 [Plasmodium ovale]
MLSSCCPHVVPVLPKNIEKLPELSNFSEEEIKEMSDTCRQKLIPKYIFEKYEEYILKSPKDSKIISEGLSKEFSENNLENNKSANKPRLIIES